MNPPMIRSAGGFFLTQAPCLLAYMGARSETCNMRSSDLPPPGFLLATAGAAVSSLLAWFVVAVIALPFAIAIETGTALSPGPGGMAALSASALLILIAQPLIAAGLLKLWLTALSDAHVGFGRAGLAMLAALVVNVAAANALPTAAAIPVLGLSWAGALAGGAVVVAMS